jgi:hypothetical protein
MRDTQRDLSSVPWTIVAPEWRSPVRTNIIVFKGAASLEYHRIEFVIVVPAMYQHSKFARESPEVILYDYTLARQDSVLEELCL